ncbi:MAG: hypothetical protein WC205_17340 [Opitutaceae bacterium]|jgi:hypothetical protein
MVNLHEYVFFGQPLNSDTNLAPTLEQIGTALTLTYRERHAMTDVSIRLQGSDTLQNWITYQPLISKDGDPNPEPPLQGGTPKAGVTSSSFGFSVIYMESNRELEISSPLQPSSLANAEVMQGFNDRYYSRLYGTIAHEIAHAPGKQQEGIDHSEGGLMSDGGAKINVDFTMKSLRRFRSATSWGS